MDGTDVLKLVLGAVVALLLARLALGALFATATLGTSGHPATATVFLPVALVSGALLLLVVLVLARTGGDETDPAIEELRRAYARGDLSDEEFERRAERLRD